MTADGLAGEVRAPDPANGAAAPRLSSPAILTICDTVLGEVGRRSHLFGWLRDPQAGPQQWLPVDAYYPGNRLVVMYCEPGDPHEGLYAELIPAHGLRLLKLDPAELEDSKDGPQEIVEELIGELGELRPPPPPGPDDQPRESVVARAVASFSQPLVRPAPPTQPPAAGQRAAAAERAARFVAARGAPQAPSSRPGRPAPASRPERAPRPEPGPRPERAPRPDRESRPERPSRPVRAPTPVRAPQPRHAPQPPPIRVPSLLVGLGLTAVLAAEIYFGVVGLVLSGHLLLAFGLAIDGCARALGTIAAARTGRQDWVWLCVIGGSPAVAAFALFHPSGPVDIEPAPLAGLLSLLAGGLIAVALITAALGI